MRYPSSWHGRFFRFHQVHDELCIAKFARDLNFHLRRDPQRVVDTAKVLDMY